MTYISLHTHEQGSQFNFIEYGGLGVNYFVRKNTALTLEGRFRHLSNAGIASPNTGINTYFIVAGISERF
jgi:lipid A 3-O-deacylase